MLRELLLADTRRRAPVVRLRRVIPAAAAVAAVLALAIGIDRALNQASGSRSVALFGASGRLVIEQGGRARLVIDGLAAAPAGSTYEAWVVGPRGAEPAGMFRGGGEHTTAVLTRPVPDGSHVAVTVERAGGAPHMAGTPIVHTARIG